MQKSNHFKQSDSRNCILYAIANALGDQSIVDFHDMINKDGGGNTKHILRILKHLGYRGDILYFVKSDKIPLKNILAYNDVIEINSYKVEKYDFAPLLVGVSGKIKNHQICVFHLLKKDVFAVVDSMSDNIIIYKTLNYILRKYNIIELMAIKPADTDHFTYDGSDHHLVKDLIDGIN